MGPRLPKGGAGAPRQGEEGGAAWLRLMGILAHSLCSLVQAPSLGASISLPVKWAQ